jgi:hypothetical protein
MNLACRVTRRFKTFRYGLAQTFLETAPSSSSFSDEYMNLALTAKEKQLLRSRKCGHSRWDFVGGNTSSRFGFFNPYPSPMNFLTKTLSRPENEKPFLLIPVGYPAEDCWVPT